jgi:hypothetical protein
LIGVATIVLGTAAMGLTGLHTAAAADPVPTTVTLPLFGAGFTFEITTGPGGNITDVTVDPADSTVATKLKPHKVVFKVSDDSSADPAKVVIKSKRGGQSVSARAGSLAEVSGPGGWSGDVFGPGTASSVDFTIGSTADGGPDITGIITSGQTAVVGMVKYFSGDDGHHHDDDDDDGTIAGARVAITFTSSGGDMLRTLKILVVARTGGEYEGAKLSMSLGRIRGVALDAAAVAGTHTWNGTLCDGSAASVMYDVAVDGSVSNVSANPSTAHVKTHDGKVWVAFSKHEWVRISVREKDGMIKINATPMMWCKGDAPTTNVDVSLPPPVDEDHDWGKGDGDGPDGFGFRDGSRHHHGD